MTRLRGRLVLGFLSAAMLAGCGGALAVCGDGVKDPDEDCDDGNDTSGDGCDANCTATACGNGFVMYWFPVNMTA